MSVLLKGRFSGALAGTTVGVSSGGPAPVVDRKCTTRASSSRIRHALIGVVVAVVAGLAVPSSASAATNGIMIAVVPEFPTRVELGSTNVAASIHVINASLGAESTGPITVTELTLLSSCGNFTPTCAGAADPGVFELSSKGTGAAGTNCANKSFDITVVDPATGRVRFTTSDGSPFLLGPADITSERDTCRIHFSLSSHRLPVIDTYPNVGEPQTNQVGFMSVRHGNGSSATDQGEDITTLVGDAKYSRWLDRSFRDLLGRAPNTDETRHWVAALTSGQQTRPQLAKAITVSTEYRNHMVNKYFMTHLGRAATRAELATHADLIAQGWSFQFSEGYVLSSDEFLALHGSTLTGFAEAMFRVVLGTAPDPGGVVWLVGEMLRGTPRFSIAVAFTTYWAAHDRLAAAAAPWLLQRPATAAEVTEWSARLDGGSRLEFLYADLVGSDEYWAQV